MIDNVTTVALRGKTIHLFDNVSSVISDHLKAGIYWDESNYDVFKKYRRPNTNFIDAGAYIGTASLLMYDILKDNNENNLIYAFEPVNHLCTELNINNNNCLETIKLYKVGLGSINCKIDLWDKESLIVGRPGQALVLLNGESNNCTLQSLQDVATDSGNIVVKTIDSYNFTNIGFIKIDCEGMELDVLKGAKETIKNNQLPPLFIEIWQNDGWRQDLSVYKDGKYRDDILNFLKEQGYYKCIHHHGDDWICLSEDDYNRTI